MTLPQNVQNAAATQRKLRTLIVDDTALYRRAVSDVLSGMEGLEVLGTASNGRIALARLEELHPDLMTLDIEMPELNGIEVLEAISAWRKKPGVIVLSSHTVKGCALTMKALELGAFDFVTKPEGTSMVKSMEALRQHLDPIIHAFMDRSRHLAVEAEVPVAAKLRNCATGPKKLVVIGVSTGGPQALTQVLPLLPKDFPLPILIVQHMPPLFTQALAESLQRKSSIQVKEAEDQEIALPGVAYIAPGGKHMKVKAGSTGEIRIVLTEDPPEHHCRPSVDYLFRSVALQFPGMSAAIILTGMGSDGAHGVKLLKKSGSFTIAQDQASSVVFGMPREAIATGCIDEVIALPKIAAQLMRVVEESKKA